MTDEKTKEFIEDVKQYINYWENQNDTKRRCLEGLAFSILVSLDGLSGGFSGDRQDLNPDTMLHEIIYD